MGGYAPCSTAGTLPGRAKFEYSNTNYNVLGLIVEAASGETYASYIQRHIFDPLEMRHSYITKAAAQKDGLAVGYRYWFGIPVPAPDLPVPPGPLPSGQLISSAEDMAHYLIAQLNGGRYGEAHVLSGAGMDEMQRGAAEWTEMGMSFGYSGMGWVSQGSGETRIVSHAGTVPDFGAFMALVPEQKKCIVLLFNANHAMIKIALDEVGMGAAQLLAGECPTPTLFGKLHWGMRGMLAHPALPGRRGDRHAVVVAALESEPGQPSIAWTHVAATHPAAFATQSRSGYVIDSINEEMMSSILKSYVDGKQTYDFILTAMKISSELGIFVDEIIPQPISDSDLGKEIVIAEQKMQEMKFIKEENDSKSILMGILMSKLRGRISAKKAAEKVGPPQRSLKNAK